LLTYAWTFGDGRSSTSANPSNTYSNLGSYTAQLTVSDRTNTGTASVQITVIANSNGLVAAYGFDEGSGTAVSDASGNGNGGVVTSANWLPSGRFGKAHLSRCLMPRSWTQRVPLRSRLGCIQPALALIGKM
jgi:PKD repeat protein